MKSTTKSVLFILTSVAVLGLIPTALAHGDETDAGMDMGQEQPKPNEESYPLTYFAHPEYRSAIYAHIILMGMGWIIVLPVAVMLSLARSRYTLVTQFLFLATNAAGVLLGTIYNAKTPDLYPNNAHHKVGWIVTWVVCTQVVIGVLGKVAGAFKQHRERPKRGGERQSFIPVSREAMEEHQRMSEYRMSDDSGQGTEPKTESLRSHSVSTSGDEGTASPFRSVNNDFHGGDDDDDDLEADLPSIRRRGGRLQSLARKAAGIVSSRIWRFLIIGYNIVDRIILILGFVTLCLGIATYGRFFEGHQIFTGLAHWIKGGIFFWMGILSLARWAGSFGELGWAWNMRPKTPNQKWRPSAEFAESALIFIYGASNIFLEHLGNWGGEYSAQDLEHMSITVLFIGGGLCGMLIESTRIRDLLNTTVIEAAHANPEHSHEDEEQQILEPPRNYEFSVNPIPALVILLLGIMMSSHTQESMVSSMIHKQWGNLLTGASFARGFSYVLMYLKPPKSVLPSRPPTELLAAFGLTAGGIIFMASSGDTVDGMIHYNLDAMFMYTVTMGLVGLLMAWVILLVALKGWAIRKEVGRPLGAYKRF